MMKIEYIIIVIFIMYILQMIFCCLLHIIFLNRKPYNLKEFILFTFLPYVLINLDRFKNNNNKKI